MLEESQANTMVWQDRGRRHSAIHCKCRPGAEGNDDPAGGQVAQPQDTGPGSSGCTVTYSSRSLEKQGSRGPPGREVPAGPHSIREPGAAAAEAGAQGSVLPGRRSFGRHKSTKCEAKWVMARSPGV